MHKGSVPVFSTLHVFCDLRFDIIPVFEGLTIICPKGPKTQAVTGLRFYTAYFNDFMVAYINNARLWLHLKVDRDYVICQGKNLFLSPAHDCIHNFIREWTLKWYQALMASTV